MKSLPEPLEPFKEFNQFIVCKLVPNKNNPEKMDKLPVNILTLQIDNAHNPKIWLDSKTALATASMLGKGFGIGFVFTKADPFYFVDIDNCLVNGKWSPTALDIIRYFPNAAIEVSQSGTGLHIFGKADAIPHACKNVPLGVEFYTEGRFAALTGNNMIGSAGVDSNEYMQAFVNLYVPPREEVNPLSWTNKPCDEWNGHDDDLKLIAAAKKSQSARARFGAGANFKDLWERNVEVLKDAYTPDSSDTGDFDESSADMALAQHLAFWTGKDCERILLIMRMSGLVRDKWTKHKGYLRTTITRAVSLQGDVYARRQANHIVSKNSSCYISVESLFEHFKGVTYIVSENRFHVFGESKTISTESFNGLFGGCIYEMDIGNSAKTTRKSSEAYLLNTVVNLPKVFCTLLDPSLPHGFNDNAVNLFIMPAIKTCAGDVSLFLKHISILLPDNKDQDILLSFLAFIVQNPGIKIRWCPVLIGTPGNGKSTISVIIEKILGYEYCHTVKSSDLGTRGKVFNGWMASKLFATLEEISGDRVEVQETLLTWITNHRLNIEAKGVEERTIKNCINFIAYSNRDDAVRITSDDRRYVVLYTAQSKKENLDQCGLSDSYFTSLYEWLNTSDSIAYIAEYLMNYEINISMNVLPDSSSQNRAIEESKSNWQLDIEAAINDGIFGAYGGFVIPRMVADNVPKRGVDKFMESHGYSKCKNRARVNGVFYRGIYTDNILMAQLSGTDLARKITETFNQVAVGHYLHQ